MCKDTENVFFMNYKIQVEWHNVEYGSLQYASIYILSLWLSVSALQCNNTE